MRYPDKSVWKNRYQINWYFNQQNGFPSSKTKFNTNPTADEWNYKHLPLVELKHEMKFFLNIPNCNLKDFEQ